MANGSLTTKDSDQDAMNLSLRNVVRKRVLDDVIATCRKENPNEYMILVLDKRATRILNSVVRMYDITQENIAVVENLHKKRQPFKELAAVYIVEPEDSSISNILHDFENQNSALYKTAHIFFTRACPLELLDKIRKNSILVSRIGCFAEMNLDFLAIESNLFHLDMPDSLVRLYNESSVGKERCISNILSGLITVCATLHEYPFIRYRADSEIAGIIACRFQELYNNHINANSSFWWRGDGQSGHGGVESRATLLMLDRSEDPAMPLLHTFTYQSMINDLLDIEDDVIRYTLSTSGTQEENKRFVLNENDPLWLELKHLHMADVLTKLKKYTEEFRDSNLRNQMKDEKGAVSLEGLIRTVRTLPEFSETQEKQLNHLNISGICMDKLQRLRLLECAKLEQLMVTGVNDDGKPISNSALTMDLMNLVKDPSIGVEETTRLLGLYLITQRGIKEEDRRRILEAANPPLPLEEQSALINLSFLGVSTEKGASKQIDRKTKKKLLSEAKELAKNCDYSYSRYVPEISRIVQQFLDNSMSPESFPYIIEPPPMDMPDSQRALDDTNARTNLSVRKQVIRLVSSTPKSTVTENLGGRKLNRARVIVFIAGGATYGEVQSLYELMKSSNREVIIGTTNILKPSEFIFNLKHLDRKSLERFEKEFVDRYDSICEHHKKVDALHAFPGQEQNVDMNVKLEANGKIQKNSETRTHTMPFTCCKTGLCSCISVK